MLVNYFDLIKNKSSLKITLTLAAVFFALIRKRIKLLAADKGYNSKQKHADLRFPSRANASCQQDDLILNKLKLVALIVAY